MLRIRNSSITSSREILHISPVHTDHPHARTFHSLSYALFGLLHLAWLGVGTTGIVRCYVSLSHVDDEQWFLTGRRIA